MLKLPNEIILELVEFVPRDGKVELINCRKEWNTTIMKKIRDLRINNYTEDSLENKRQLITDPYRQLTLFPDKLSSDQLISVLSSFDYSVYDFLCTKAQLMEIMKSTERLRVKSLVISVNVPSSPHDFGGDINNILTKVFDCEQLAIFCRETNNLSSMPFLPSLKQLSFHFVNFRSNLQFLQPYSRSLQSLSLSHCDITDVTMLGSIPVLELKYCRSLVDISSLNHNDRVKVFACSGIRDYSHSFANARKIEVDISGENISYRFDIARWKNVTDLKLIGNTSIDFHHSNRLPQAVRRCHLGGRFVTAIDFTITADHLLNELKLSNEDTITNLEGFGLERVALIECDGMKSLQSLQGLGRGRNKMIIINDCVKISDFSPLNHIPIVKIRKCEGFTDSLQLRFVHNLTVVPIKRISFKSIVNPHTLFENIHTLTLIDRHHNVKEFDGLESIPYLNLHMGSYQIIKEFLKRGKSFNNKRIELYDHYAFYHEIDDLVAKIDVHVQFLKDHYDYHFYNRWAKRWIWFRIN